MSFLKTIKAMTISNRRSLQALVIFALSIVLFSGCLKDNCTSLYTYKLYKPIYMSFEELRGAVKSEPAQALSNVGKIYYKAPYIYINEVDKGIHIIDNSDPSAPDNIGFINIPGCIDISIKDNILYADSYIDLVAIDIGDPLQVKEVFRNNNVFPNRIYNNGWSFDATKGVIIGWNESDTTIEYSCNSYFPVFYSFDYFVAGATNSGASSGGAVPASGASAAPGTGIAGSLARFAIYDNFLYCLDNSMMKLFDISNAAQPVNSTEVQMPWNIETIFPYDHYLFIGTTTGILIYDNANPSSPSYVSQLAHVSSCDPVVVQGDYAYATLRDGTTCQGFSNELEVIDISNIWKPVLKSTVFFTHPFGLGIDKNDLFVCDDSYGLKHLDASNPLDLNWIETLSAGATRDVIPLGNLLLLIADNGLYQFDYSSGKLSQISYLPIGK